MLESQKQPPLKKKNVFQSPAASTHVAVATHVSCGPFDACHSQHGRSMNPGTDYMCVCSKISVLKLPVWVQVYKGAFFSPALLASPSSNISFHQSFTLSIQWAPSLLLFSLSTPPPPHTHPITSILLKTLRPFFNNITYFIICCSNMLLS